MTTSIPSQDPALTSNALSLQFQWDRATTDQFEMSSGWQTDLGGAFAGTVTPSVVGSGYQNEPVLRFTCAGLTGGQAAMVKTSEYVLPASEPYMVYVRLARISNSSINGRVMLFMSDTAGVIRGFGMARLGGSSSNQDWRLIRNDKEDISVQSGNNVGQWGAATEAIGGEEYWFEVMRRQNGSASPNFAVRSYTQGYGLSTNGVDAAGAYPGLFTIGTDWNSQDMTRIGIGVWTGSSAQDGEIDFLDYRIFKSSLDR